jgi:hypothetical protein
VARGRSCASILVVPRRKTSLGEPPRGRAAMARVGAPWEARLGVGPQWGVMKELSAAAPFSLCMEMLQREEEEQEEREEKEKREGEKEKLLNLEILENKNKR